MSEPRRTNHAIDPLFIQRWSPRSFSGDGITQQQLECLIEAARWSPSAFNVQPWRFIYAHKDTPEWDPIFGTLKELNRAWAARAAAIIVVASAKKMTPPGASLPTDNPWHSFDAGFAWASIAFQAKISGLVAHAMGGFDGAKLRDATGLPEEFAINAVIAVGRQGDKKLLPESFQAREQPTGRHSLDAISFAGRFQPA